MNIVLNIDLYSERTKQNMKIYYKNTIIKCLLLQESNYSLTKIPV